MFADSCFRGRKKNDEARGTNLAGREEKKQAQSASCFGEDEPSAFSLLQKRRKKGRNSPHSTTLLSSSRLDPLPDVASRLLATVAVAENRRGLQPEQATPAKQGRLRQSQLLVEKSHLLEQVRDSGANSVDQSDARHGEDRIVGAEGEGRREGREPTTTNKTGKKQTNNTQSPPKTPKKRNKCVCVFSSFFLSQTLTATDGDRLFFFW